MKKKLLFSTVIAFSIGLIFSFSCVFANTNPIEGIRNAVGGAENVVENAAGGITNGIRNTTGTMTNGMDNNVRTNNNTNNSNKVTGGIINNNDGYTATRTATGFNEPTLLGINMTAWTWIIIAIAAVGIITLIWSYTSQHDRNYNSYHE